MRGASPYTKAGASFRERQRTIDNDTKERAAAMAQEVSLRTHKAIDDFELLHNMVDDEDIKKSKKERKRKNKVEKEKDEEGTGELVNPPDTSRSGHNYAIRPCECTLFYNFGSATVRPTANTSFDSKLRESVQSAVHGTKKTFISAPFGGQSFCLAEPCLCRPNVEPVLPVHGVADVPPLARSLSRQQIQDRGGTNNQKMHPMVTMNRATSLRQAQMYRYIAQSEISEAFNEQFEWEAQRGHNFHNVSDKYHKYLDQQAAENVHPHAWMSQNRADWTDDQKKVYEILSRLEDYLHDHMTRATEVFKLLDEDHSGEIDPDELLQGLSTRGAHGEKEVCGIRLGICKPGEMNRSDVWKIMQLIDPNCDGTISLKELDKIILIIGKMKVSSGERKRWTFDHSWTDHLQDETIAKMNMDALESPV